MRKEENAPSPTWSWTMTSTSLTLALSILAVPVSGLAGEFVLIQPTLRSTKLLYAGDVLAGRLGKNTESESHGAASPYFTDECFVSTSTIGIAVPSEIDVQAVYDADISFWDVPDYRATMPVFWIMAGPDGPDAVGNKTETVVAGNLLRMRTLVSPHPDFNGWGMYEAETVRPQVVALRNVKVEVPTDRFQVHVCRVGPGARVTIREISIEIRPVWDEAYCQKTVMQSGFVADKSVLHCSYRGSVATGCALAPRELSGPREEEAAFRVRYVYDCPGAPLGLHLRTDVMEKELKSSPVAQEVVLNGKEFLRLEAKRPAATYVAYVEPQCGLKVLGVDAAPSAATLVRWRDQAAALSESLRLLVDLMQLAKGVERILEWDNAQLAMLEPNLIEAMERHLWDRDASWEFCGGVERLLAGQPPTCAAWAQAVSENPEVLDSLVLLLHIRAMVGGRPQALPTIEVQHAAARLREPLGRHYERALRAKVAEVERFRDKLRAARRAAHADLVFALDEIETISTSATTSVIVQAER